MHAGPHVVLLNNAVLYILQDSFVSNLHRLIHTMKPPNMAKKGKKKKVKKESGSCESSSPVLDPAVEARRQRFPGLSLPDDADRVHTLLKPEEVEGMEDSQDAKVASEALNEVRFF